MPSAAVLGVRARLVCLLAHQPTAASWDHLYLLFSCVPPHHGPPKATTTHTVLAGRPFPPKRSLSRERVGARGPTRCGQC
jgi:hypothetical protein